MIWTYPGKDQDPWFESFRIMVDQMDASGFAAREDRQLILAKGGDFLFDSTAQTLTWNADLEIASMINGFKLSIEPPVSPLSFLDGSVLFVDLVRSPTINAVLTPQVAAQVGNTNTAYVIAVRSGTDVFFRHGFKLPPDASQSVFPTLGGGDSDENVKVSANDTTASFLGTKLVQGSNIVLTQLNDGGNETLEIAASAVADESVKVSANDTTAAFLGTKLVQGTNIVLTELNDGSNETLQVSTSAAPVKGTIIWAGGRESYNSELVPFVVSAFAFAPTDYDPVTTITFQAIAANGNAGLTTHVRLINITDAETVADLTFTTTATAKNSVVLTRGAGVGEIKETEKIYEVQIQLTAAPGPTDSIELFSAELRLF